MKVEIRCRDFEVTDALRNFTNKRLEVAFDRFRDRIGRVEASLVDLNGPRGGIDKQCRLRTRLAGRGEMTASATDAELYPAIVRAVYRLGDRVARALELRRQRGSAGRGRRYPTGTPGAGRFRDRIEDHWFIGRTDGENRIRFERRRLGSRAHARSSSARASVRRVDHGIRDWIVGPPRRPGNSHGLGSPALLPLASWLTSADWQAQLPRVSGGSSCG